MSARDRKVSDSVIVLTNCKIRIYIGFSRREMLIMRKCLQTKSVQQENRSHILTGRNLWRK